jgi:putative endonuclease
MRPTAAGRALGKRQRAYRYGRRAERLAVWYLWLKGYRVLARDRRSAAGEIDIIARRGRTIAVIEVKARGSLATAAESLGGRQRTRILRATHLFLAGRPDLAQHQVRFDVIWVAPGRLPRHVVDAWRPEALQAGF